MLTISLHITEQVRSSVNVMQREEDTARINRRKCGNRLLKQLRAFTFTSSASSARIPTCQHGRASSSWCIQNRFLCAQRLNEQEGECRCFIIIYMKFAQNSRVKCGVFHSLELGEVQAARLMCQYKCPTLLIVTHPPIYVCQHGPTVK